MMTPRENLLRTVHFDKPERIPMTFCFNGACFNHYPIEALDELRLSHPYLFPGFKPQAPSAKPRTPAQQSSWMDAWGVTIESPEEGIMGVATHHPLADWNAFDKYVPPPPAQLTPEEQKRPHLAEENRMEAQRKGYLIQNGLPHGHTFLRLCDIRGYENLICDMADDEPRLGPLIEMVENYNRSLVKCDLLRGAEWMAYPEDLGMQIGPMLSPEHLRRYIKPSYTRLMKWAQDAGCIIHMHSDGDIRDLVDDLVDSGVQVVNLQDLVNGVDWIRARLKGKYCIDLDIDRQAVTRFGTPQEIDDLIRQEVATLGSKEGGLMMIYGLYPGIPLANANALMDAMEKYSTYFA